MFWGLITLTFYTAPENGTCDCQHGIIQSIYCRIICVYWILVRNSNSHVHKDMLYNSTFLPTSNQVLERSKEMPPLPLFIPSLLKPIVMPKISSFCGYPHLFDRSVMTTLITVPGMFACWQPLPPDLVSPGLRHPKKNTERLDSCSVKYFDHCRPKKHENGKHQRLYQAV